MDQTAVKARELKKLLDRYGDDDTYVLASINGGEPFAVFHGNITYTQESRADMTARGDHKPVTWLTLDFYNSHSPPSKKTPEQP